MGGDGMIELKPCPCCNGKASIVWRAFVGRYSASRTDAFGHAVECGMCGLSTMSYSTETDAAESWNMRVKSY